MGEFPRSFVSVSIGVSAVSVRFATTEITDVFISIGIGVGAVSQVLATPEFTDIFVTFELVVC